MPSSPLRLRCEFVSDPLGITALQPRLSWWVNDPRPAELQSAFEILAASSVALLDADEGDLWRSGRVEGNLSAHVIYRGAALQCQQRVWWKVRTFDSDGLGSPWSDPAFFETGLLQPEDWHGKWIASPLRGSLSRGVQVAALRRDFLITQEVLAARLYVAAMGAYRVELNGQSVPRSEAATVWTDYARRVIYQCYDVTAMLIQEPNAIGVLLADGYYAGEIGDFGRGHYGDRPQLKLHLEITTTSGERMVLASDHQWHWRPSWILASEIHGGEHTDYRQFVDSWSEAGLDERQWAPVEVLPEHDIALVAQGYPAFGVQQVLRPRQLPKKYQHPGRTSLVYDFGDEILGRVNIDLVSHRSDDVVLTYCLSDTFEQTTQDTITTVGGSQLASLGSMFSLHQFRYVQVDICPRDTELGEVSAHRLGAPQRSGLSLRSDHPTLNELFETIDNTLQALSTSVPLLGVQPSQHVPDAAYGSTWIRYAARHNRAHALISKWIDDLLLACDVSQASGFVPDIARAVPQKPVDEIAHFEAIVSAAWALYRHQGDDQVLTRCYARIRTSTLSYRHMHDDLVRAPINSDLYGEAGVCQLVATATVYRAIKCAGRIAGVLGHLGDYELIENLAEDVRRAFRRRFLTQDGHLAASGQSACVAALYHNLLEPAEAVIAQQQLVALLQENQYHVDVAPSVLHALLPVLTTAGRLDVAYMVLLQTSEPSWMSAIRQGSRHIGVRTKQPDIAHVGLLEWLMGSLVGLSLHEDYSPEHNGYRCVRIRPMPPLGHQFLAGSPVEFIEAALETMHGGFEVKWWIHKDHFELELLIPPGATALVTMPDDIEQTVRSGYHRFIMDFGAGGDGVPILLDTAAGEH